MNTKKQTVNAAIQGDRPERKSLSAAHDRLYYQFYRNIRVLCALEDISMSELAGRLHLKSGKRLYDFSYGRGTPSAEELIILSRHFNCSIDNLLNRKAIVRFDMLNPPDDFTEINQNL